MSEDQYTTADVQDELERMDVRLAELTGGVGVVLQKPCPSCWEYPSDHKAGHYKGCRKPKIQDEKWKNNLLSQRSQGERVIKCLSEFDSLEQERERYREERDGAYNDLNIVQIRVNWLEQQEEHLTDGVRYYIQKLEFFENALKFVADQWKNGTHSALVDEIQQNKNIFAVSDI